MSREVRKVPKHWSHPKKENGRLIPLFDRSWARHYKDWAEEKQNWEAGIFPDYASEESRKLTYEEWAGKMPDPTRYMPDFPEEMQTHLQMYETTSEGTPISPVMETPEELARWLADNNASAFGSMTVTYEQWLAMIRAGWDISAVVDKDGFQSGVEHCGKEASNG